MHVSKHTHSMIHQPSVIIPLQNRWLASHTHAGQGHSHPCNPNFMYSFQKVKILCMTTRACAEESIQTVMRHIKEHGPYDGLLGFSQGAALVTLLCMLGSPPGVRFVMLFGGYAPPRQLDGHGADLSHAVHALPDTFGTGLRLRDATLIDVPSLHVWGSADTQVPSELSLALSRLYKAPEVHVHGGGHFIPTAPESRVLYRSFVARHQALSVRVQSTSVSPRDARSAAAKGQGGEDLLEDSPSQ
jgi:pimeloyl-ACP methyl ester carboxylesterase